MLMAADRGQWFMAKVVDKRESDDMAQAQYLINFIGWENR
jgi:hypothetical protein